jgi:Cytochrome c3
VRAPLLALLFAPLAAVAAFGDSVCAACHVRETSHFSATPMGHALQTVESCDILKNHPDLQFQEGPYHTQIMRVGDRSIITITRGAETFTVPILYAFGQGKAGQTYVFELDGAFYESRASFYDALAALDLTIGDIGTKPQTLVEAAGRRLNPGDAASCFACHSHGGIIGGIVHLEAVTPGVGCQSCHGQAVETHASAMRAGNAAAAKPRRLGSLASEDMSELCGTCHRTWSQVAQLGMRGPNTVRFQPYRLTNSKCYDVEDPRIRCTACHDPHGQVHTDLASYDSKCTACHSTALHAKVCSVAKDRCVTCHMPKVDLPGAHAQFTDHQIRIARAGDPFPN